MTKMEKPKKKKAARPKRRIWTQKKEAFCKFYVVDDNATEAYRQAYNTDNMKKQTMSNNGYILLKHEDVQARIKELRNEIKKIAKKKFNIEKSEILRQLNLFRQSNIQDYVDLVEDPTTKQMVLRFKPFSKLTKDQLECIESVKEGRNGIELKLQGKDWSIEKINKHIGLYEKDNEQKANVKLTPMFGDNPFLK